MVGKEKKFKCHVQIVMVDLKIPDKKNKFGFVHQFWERTNKKGVLKIINCNNDTVNLLASYYEVLLYTRTLMGVSNVSVGDDILFGYMLKNDGRGTGFADQSVDSHLTVSEKR